MQEVLPFTLMITERHAALVYSVLLWSTDTCQIEVSVDKCHVTISRAQVYSSSRSLVFLKLITDQVLVSSWIAAPCQVQLICA